MSTAVRKPVGPELPPHLAKRKREQEAQEPQTSRFPSPPSPPTRSSSDSPKRRRVLGPSLPPAPLSELPPSAPSHSDSDSDSDFGPSLPTHTPSAAESLRQQTLLEEQEAAAAFAEKPKREEWMLLPPTSSDWSSRIIDPTKIRNRKFNTGKGAKAPLANNKAGGGGGDNRSIWTETPEQKLKRLEDEVMGIKPPAAQLENISSSNRDERAELEAAETSRRIAEYNAKNRSTSLYAEHAKSSRSKSGVAKEKEDDPSKRAFDKEKDIRGGIKLGHAQKRELLNRAADFGSRFARGKYLWIAAATLSPSISLVSSTYI